MKDEQNRSTEQRPGRRHLRMFLSRLHPSYHLFILHPSYFQSGSSGCFRSHSGRRLRTVGIDSKLYDGGGEVVAHSSVQASQGSSPAGRPRRSDTATFAKKIRNATPCTTTPSVLSWFHRSQPRSGM